MLPEHEIATLRQEEKDAILDAMLGMAWSDSEAETQEIELIKTYAAALTKDDFEALVRDYQPDMERVGRKIVKADLSGTGRRLLVRSLALVMAASGTVADTELAFYQQIVRAFGIPERERKKLEDGVRRDVFADLILRALAAPEADRAARLRDAHAERERLGLSADAAKEIEERVRREAGASQ